MYQNTKIYLSNILIYRALYKTKPTFFATKKASKKVTQEESNTNKIVK